MTSPRGPASRPAPDPTRDGGLARDPDHARDPARDGRPTTDPDHALDPGLDPRLTVGQVVDRLGLEPHPEGGYFRVAWRSGRVMDRAMGRGAGGTAQGPRVLAGAIHFLVPAGPATRWHRVHHEEEVWAWQAGGTLALRSGGLGPAPAWTTPDPAGPSVTPAPTALAGPPGARVPHGLAGPAGRRAGTPSTPPAPSGTTVLGAGGTLLHALAEGEWQQAQVAAGAWVLVLAITCPGYDDADLEMLP